MKKVKKVVLLMILMILSLHASSLAASGSASGKVTLTPSKTEVESGEEFSVTISQECSDGIIGFEAALEYDTNLFEFKKVNTLNDWVYLGEGTKLDAMSNEDKKSGEVMKLDFAVKEGVAETTSPIKVNQIKLFKTYDEKLEIAEQTVSIKVKGKEEDKKDEEKTPVLSQIAITKIPNKIAYTEGESFSTNGMVITATYDNGTSKEVTDYKYSPNSALKTGNNSITISYTENGTTKTTTQSITVKAASGTPSGSDNKNNTNTNTNTNNNNNGSNNSNNNNNKTQNTNTNNTANTGKNNTNTTNKTKNTSADNTTTGTNLPKTGGTSNIVLAIVGVLIIIGFACYFGYRKYKEI